MPFLATSNKTKLTPDATLSFRVAFEPKIAVFFARLPLLQPATSKQAQFLLIFLWSQIRFVPIQKARSQQSSKSSFGFRPKDSKFLAGGQNIAIFWLVQGGVWG